MAIRSETKPSTSRFSRQGPTTWTDLEKRIPNLRRRMQQASRDFKDGKGVVLEAADAAHKP